MLLIIVDDKPLELHSTSLDFVLKSCIEIDKGIPGSYIFNFAVSSTDRNNAIFGYPHRLTKSDLSPKEYPCTVISFGKSRTGVITVESANPKYIELSVSLDAGPYNQLVGETLLPDIFDQSISLGSTMQNVIDYANSVATLYYPDTHFTFPSVFNDYLYGDPNDEDTPSKNLDFLNICNLYLDGSFVSNDIVPLGADNKNSLIPYFFVNFIVTHCFTHYGYNLEGKILQHPEYSQLLLANNFTLDLIEDRYSYQGLRNTYGYAGNSGFQEMFINEDVVESDNSYDEANNRYVIQAEGTHDMVLRFDINVFDTISPWVTIQFIKNGVDVFMREHAITGGQYETIECNYQQYYNAGDFGDTLYAQIRVLDQGNPADFNIINAEFTVTNVSQCALNRLQKTIEYKNHIPNVLITDFLQSFFLLTATFPIFDHNLKTCKLVSITDVLSTFPPIPFSDNIVPYSLKSTVNDYDGLTFSYDFKEKDDFYKKVPEDLGDIYRTLSSYLWMPFSAPEASVIFVESINKYFKLVHKQYPDGTVYWEWEYLADKLGPYEIDNGSRSIPFKMSPLTMFFSELYELNIPATRTVGKSIAYNSDPDELGMKITFWRGMTDSESTDYPMAGSYKLGTNNTKLYNCDLRLEDPDGVINTFWLPVIEWYKTRIPIEFKKQLTQADLHKIIFDSIFRVGEINLVLGQASFKLSMDSLGQAKIKGWHL